MADETLWIWGNAIYGMYPIKTQKTIQHVIAEGMHVLILTVDGEVYAWGEHAVRPGDTILKNNRTEIAEDWSSWYGTEAHRLQELTHVKEIALDPRGFFALARKEDGSIWIWGENTITNIPRAVPLTNVPIVKRSHESISVKSDGSFYLVDDQGQLWFIALIFTKNASSAHSFVRVETRICNHPSHEAVQEVSAGPYITLIRTVSGQVWMKGAGNDVFVPVSGIDRARHAVAGEGVNGYVICEDGTLWEVGYEKGTPLALGIAPLAQSFTTFVDNNGRQWISSEPRIISDPVLERWKAMDEAGYTAIARQIKGIEDVKQIADGATGTLALKEDGSVWALWGYWENEYKNSLHDDIRRLQTEGQFSPELTQPLKITWVQQARLIGVSQQAETVYLDQPGKTAGIYYPRGHSEWELYRSFNWLVGIVEDDSVQTIKKRYEQMRKEQPHLLQPFDVQWRNRMFEKGFKLTYED